LKAESIATSASLLPDLFEDTVHIASDDLAAILVGVTAFFAPLFDQTRSFQRVCQRIPETYCVASTSVWVFAPE
jgi:hypothetical protein